VKRTGHSQTAPGAADAPKWEAYAAPENHTNQTPHNPENQLEDLMSVTCNFGPANARLTMTGELTPELVLDMRRHFRNAVEYYRYDLIEIEIDSPGGDAHALKALSTEMQWLQRHGCVIQTTAMLQACSAGALTLAMGTVGMRTIQPYTNLLFHNARVTPQGERAMTAANALAAASHLQRLDGQVVELFVNHLTNARGGLQGLAMAGLTRCQTLQREAATVVREHGIEATISADLWQKSKERRDKGGWIKSTITAYEQVLKSNKAQAYTSLLAALFALDDKMPFEMAWTLQLIDHVESSSVLRPEIESRLIPEDDAANHPSMRLAA
jgi:ATP-dependent protease ClpP protease subunit